MFFSRSMAVKAIDQKRKKQVRSANFSEREIKLLCDLVVGRPEIIESKNTDAKTWRKKEQEWQAITAEFNNSTFDGFRTPKGLRTKYEALKKEIRKKLLRRKMEISQNGDVSYDDVEYTDNEKKILWLLSPSPRESLEGNDKNNESVLVMDPHAEFVKCENLNGMKIEIIKVNDSGDMITNEDTTMFTNPSNEYTPSESSSRSLKPSRKRETNKLESMETISLPYSFNISGEPFRSNSVSEEEYIHRERELKLMKLEAEVQSTMLDVEIKKLEKKIKEATLRKILCDN